MKGRSNVLGGYGGMDPVEKMDCRANGELIWEPRTLLQPHLCEMSLPLIQMDRDKKMTYAIESLRPRTTDGRSLLPTTTAKGEKSCSMNRPLINSTR